jgi:RNA polymerase sigma-70 factor, ECF subfamily
LPASEQGDVRCGSFNETGRSSGPFDLDGRTAVLRIANSGRVRETEAVVVATARIVESLRPVVIRCVRAELAADVGHRASDLIAADICHSIATRLTRPDRSLALTVMTEEIGRRMDFVRRNPNRHSRADLLAGLPEPEHTVLVLRLIGGLTIDESAQALGISAATVRLSQHRGLNLLRARQGLSLPSP